MTQSAKTIKNRNILNILFKKVPPEYHEKFKATRLKTNINRMFAFSIYIIILQITLNIINIVKPADSKNSDIIIYIVLSMATLLIGVIYCVLLALAKRRKIKNTYFKAFLVQSLLYLYIAIQLIFCTLNIISTGGINSYIIAILIVGLVPIISPRQSILSIIGALIYVITAMYFTRNISNTWDSILLTDVWTNLIIITGITICISVFINQMYVSNFLQSMSLAKANEDLEQTVHERTRELEAQTVAAQIANRAKTEFLARMSHEIRTPLNAITGMAQIARKYAENEKTITSINEIETASVHLLGLLNDVLDMSKIGSGKFELATASFNLYEALDEVVSIIKLRSNEKNLAFNVNFAELSRNIIVLGDKMRLKQVLINLLGNAVKFTINGAINFEIKVTEENATDLSLTFIVSDQGIGMSPEQLDKLFVAFEQADSTIATRFGGTGLGLAISQSLVQKMGGHINVSSEPHKGSVFNFSLSLPKAAATDERDEDMATIVPCLANKNILLVDDNEINRMIIIELLANTEAYFDEVEDGLEALTKFQASPAGHYCLIFMDVQMPNMDGYATTRAIRELDRPDAKTVPILAMTANAYREDVNRALEAGMNGHVSKPVEINTVMNMLAQIIAQ